MALNVINGKLKLLHRKIDMSLRSFADCSAMLLLSIILIIFVQLGTLISMKKPKRKTNNAK